MYIYAQMVRAGTFALPGCFVLAETIFLTDLVGVTVVLPTYLAKVAPLTLVHILT
jgi:hypothetical protein